MAGGGGGGSVVEKTAHRGAAGKQGGDWDPVAPSGPASSVLIRILLSGNGASTWQPSLQYMGSGETF